MPRGIARPVPVVPSPLHDSQVQRDRKTVLVPSGRTIAGAERKDVGPGTRIVDLTFAATISVPADAASGATLLPPYRWVGGLSIIAPVANPANSPCVYWQKIHLPCGLILDRYQYGMRSIGTAAHGSLCLSVYSEVAGAPAVEYLNARARAFHHTRPVGLAEVYCGDGVGLQVRKTVTLLPGNVWVSCCVDTFTGFGVTTPDIDYFSGGYVGSVGRSGLKVVPVPAGFAEIGDIYDTPAPNVPAIYLHGTLP